MAVNMTETEALNAVFEAAEYALENDYEYIEKSTATHWGKALRELRKRLIVVLDPTEVELVREALINESYRRKKASRMRTYAGPQYAEVRADLRQQSADCMTLANHFTN